MIKRNNTYGSGLLILTIIGLICIAWSSKSMAFDKEAFCRFDMKFNQERAEWGSKLRQEMLVQCRNKDLQKCGQQYVSLISRQYEKDVTGLIEKDNNSSQAVRIRTQATVMFMQSAALEALKTDKSPNSIAVDMYSQCLLVR